MDNNFFDILVPLGICVVLPVMIVWLITRKQQNETNRKTEIMLKAIETGQKIDSEFFSIQKKASKSIKERLWDRLVIAWMTTIFAIIHTIFGTSIHIGDLKLDRSLFDCIFLAIGISFFISYSVGKKIFKKEMEAEAESESEAQAESEAEAEAETKTIEQK